MHKSSIKTVCLFVLLLIILLFASGCSGSDPADNGIPSPDSYLRSTVTQNNLAQIMTEAGISDTRQTILFDHINQFNTLTDPKPGYDPYEMQDRWNELSPDFTGYNCRITSFGIFGDYIAIPPTSAVREDMVLFDLTSLSEDPSVLLTEDDLARFSVLYSTVPTTFTKDTSVHAKNLTADWYKRGIRFLSNDKASLITVIFHETFSEDENYLFVGHTGILFEADDKLVFVEKIAFQEPYCMTEFETRQQLKDYLITKYDVSYDQPAAPPFVMENDELM